MCWINMMRLLIEERILKNEQYVFNDDCKNKLETDNDERLIETQKMSVILLILSIIFSILTLLMTYGYLIRPVFFLLETDEEITN